MNTRKFRTDKESLIKEGKRIVSTDDDTKFVYKVTLVNLMLGGLKASALSEFCKETARTLTSWVKAVDENGFEALRVKKQPGRPSRLSKAQKEEIYVALTKDPQLYGYNLWDGPTLSDYISTQYRISLGPRQCERLFHELGFSLIRPQTFPSKGKENAPERDEFKKKFTS